MADYNYKFPQYLSSPMQFLWFEEDTFFLLSVCLGIGFMLGGWSKLLVVIGPIGYAKIKKKYSSSFLKHTMYFTGFKKTTYYPSFFVKNFQE
jgi:type IV conjugative transfer system protein TraL